MHAELCHEASPAYASICLLDELARYLARLLLVSVCWESRGDLKGGSQPPTEAAVLQGNRQVGTRSFALIAVPSGQRKKNLDMPRFVHVTVPMDGTAALFPCVKPSDEDVQWSSDLNPKRPAQPPGAIVSWECPSSCRQLVRCAVCCAMP